MVLICNPLTKECLQFERALISIEKETEAYKVIVASDDMISSFVVKNLTTEMYDLVCQFWRIIGPLPRLCNLESGKITHANGILYRMNYNPFSVLTYDLEFGVRSSLRFRRSHNLVECRGRMVMVDAIHKSKLNVPKRVQIWVLQDSRTGWVELERMPQSLYDEFMQKVCEQPNFQLHPAWEYHIDKLQQKLIYAYILYLSQGVELGA